MNRIPDKLIAIVLFTLSLFTRVTNAEQVDFVQDVRPILQKHCYSCHGAEKQKSGLRLDIKSEAFKGGEAYGPSLVARMSKASPLIQFIRGDGDLRMPPEGEGLSDTEIALLTTWVDQGAKWPDGVDLAKLEDKRDHWSLKPLTHHQPPKTNDTAWPRRDLDRFILQRLEQEGLRPAQEADAITWLRRVSLDLVGLPPTPEEVAAFVSDVTATNASDAETNAKPLEHKTLQQEPVGTPHQSLTRAQHQPYEAVVDRLLASPLYGERWAQHWLDVVRYADTHGFEVNTERPNAWPYRDYVIHAFNNDTPFDRFVREQIAGDAFDQEVATGFLITASVLLPGQIGQDDVSKRLARQDSLDEIVGNIGQTFLGLSIGCARCHDHKFDPISQRDYYAMQAFIAGVEYADRELRKPDDAARQAQIESINERLAEIDRALSKFEPVAQVETSPRQNQKPDLNQPTFLPPARSAVNARMNTDRIVPAKTKRLRFTINATNNLEPCIDELEVFDVAGRNIALASSGAAATSSGDTVVADRHELRQINDGRYGNSCSWMSNESGKGWVVLEFPEEFLIDRIVWGRDREGMFTDRLAIDYRIEVANAADQWRTVATSMDRAVMTSTGAGLTAPSASTTGLRPEESETVSSLIAERKALQLKLTGLSEIPKAFAGTFRTPDVIRLLTRGDPEQPKDEIMAAIPTALGPLELSSETPEQSRRIALANWITSAENPLTSRVMVNRIWQGHFGTGLVETASDFGRMGTKPSHPELLDWLAAEFVRSGWSIKQLHRQIVLSATYRQSARTNPAGTAADVDVRWLWRYPSRRLDAETIRDSILAVSGRLNLAMGGRGFDLFDKRGGLSGFIPVESFSGDGCRRMIYAHKVRRERDAIFGAFDCPDAGQSTARRRESTTPIQALNLFNSRFTLEQADALVTRVKVDVGEDVSAQIRRIYQLALSRDPEPDEIATAGPIVREHGLGTLGRALFNCNEFLFLP